MGRLAVAVLLSLIIIPRADAMTAEDAYFADRDAAITAIKAANKPVGPVAPVLSENSIR